MKIQKALNPHFEVSASVSYIAAESKPDQNYFFFSYRVSIKNIGSAPGQLMSRHWIITDAVNHVEEVRGPGVVGLQPKIQPGQSYEYDSACPLHTSSGSMKGSYQFTSENGETFEVPIPEFFLIAPQALH